MDAIIYSAGPLTTKFFVAINAKKTFKEFYEHEKHIGYTKEQLREAYELIRKKAKSGHQPEEVQPDQPLPDNPE